MSARRRSALGLVELMLAALILASAVGVLFQALGLSVRGTEQVAEELVATQIASELVDMFSSLPHAELPATPEAPPAAAVEKLADRVLAERLRKRLDALTVPNGYQALVAIDALGGDAGIGRAKRILVTVRWTGTAGARPAGRSVKLARLIADEVGLEP